MQNALYKGLSLHRGPVGNLEGVRLPRLLREKKSISGFLSWTLRPLRFEVGEPSGTLVKEQGSPELILDYGAQRGLSIRPRCIGTVRDRTQR